MARQRLGVVLLVPQPLATQIDGLRRALGDDAFGRIPPHVTLVPPVNVTERDLPVALEVVRRAAAATPTLALTVGPVATFHPVNPVAYLSVDGDDDQIEALTHLREACLAAPLDRPQDHEFVPHVTIASTLDDERLAAVTAVLTDLVVHVAIERVHVLAEQAGRQWVPIADAPLGVDAATVGLGSLPLEMTVSGRPDLEAAALLAVDGDGSGLPFAVTARRDGNVVAAAWGWTAGGHLELGDLVVAVAHRSQGVGRHLLAAVEQVGRTRECATLGTVAPPEGAAASLLRAAGWRMPVATHVAIPVGDAGEAPARGRRRWERSLVGGA